jgi:hypothetical protein
MRLDWAILTLAVVTVPVRAQWSGVATVKAGPAVAARVSSGPPSVALSESSDLVGGSLIGYAVRADRSGVIPLQGFPGAAFPGPTLTLAEAGGIPVVSSVGGYALAASRQPGELLVYGLRPRTVASRVLPSTVRLKMQADQIVLSPLGRAALIYDRERREIEVLVGLPARPTSLYTASLAGVQGVLTALAVSDDGAVALAAFSSANSPGEIYAMRRDAPASLVGQVSRVVHLAFVPNAPDALAADYERSQVLLLKDGGRQGMQVLAGSHDGLRSPTAVEASTQGSIFVVNEGSETLVMLSGQAALPGLVRCGCPASGLERLNDPDSFRLTRGEGVIAVLEAHDGPANVFYVPAGVAADQEPSIDKPPSRGRSR